MSLHDTLRHYATLPPLRVRAGSTPRLPPARRYAIALLSAVARFTPMLTPPSLSPLLSSPC